MKIFSKFLSGFLVLLLSFSLTTSLLAATSIGLGSASDFAVLAGSTITNTGSSVIGGKLGLTPGTSVTGFPPGTVNGIQEVTNGVASQAQSDLAAAYNAAAGQTGAITVSGDLGGQTLVPGVYKSASSLGLTGTLILDGGGNANAVFIFQAGSTLITASDSNVVLINGAQACNVFWQVTSSATLGTGSDFKGNILALVSITDNGGSTVDGRLLARNGAVTLNDTTITKANCSVPTPVQSSGSSREGDRKRCDTPFTPTCVEYFAPKPMVLGTSTPIEVYSTTTQLLVMTFTPGMPSTGGTSTSFLPILVMSLSIGFIIYGVVYVNQKKS